MSQKEQAEAGLSYEDVKRIVNIPSTWWAKITGAQFKERTSKPVPKRGRKKS